MDRNTIFNLRKQNSVLRKAVKATIKGTIIYVAYFFLSQFITPLSQFVPGLQQTIETFVIVYIVLIIIAELTSGTIFQHIFNAAKALFIVAYIAASFGTGAFNVDVEGTNVLIDFRVVLVIAMMLSLTGLAKSVLETVNYMNEKAEVILTP